MTTEPIRLDVVDRELLVGDERWLRLDHLARHPTEDSVHFEVMTIDPTAVELRITARAALTGIATGAFADPAVGWSLRPHRPVLEGRGVQTFGYQYMEFALPSIGAVDGTGLAPWPLRPPAAMPLVWAGPGTPALLVGPLDRFHDQVVAVPSDEVPRDDLVAGWHGDLDEVPEGFTSSFVVLAAATVRAAIDAYGALVRARHGTRRVPHRRDPGVRGVSYWTDNGAEYYYRAEPGLDHPTTLARALEALEADGLPIHAVEIDSWFYPQEHSRGLEEGAEVVPPSGGMRWEPREDALPGGFAHLRDAVGNRPLIAHSRHLSARSPYFGAGGFAGHLDDGSGHAHPVGDDLLDAWMEQAATWGLCTYEQDWLVEAFLTVEGLRRTTGAGDAWQVGMDRAAARRGLTLQFCMATPADFLHTVRMTQVSSIRTSMDFRYAVGRQANWGWFLHVNALARALGLAVSKDVFLAARREDGSWEDPLAAAEALLAALSCGPVGIGDRIGTTDVDLVRRTCREDGLLVGPDVPVAARSASFLDEPMGAADPLVGECWTDHPAGRWHYVAALGERPEARCRVEVGLDELDGATGEHRARRFGTGEVTGFDAGRPLGLEPDTEAFDLWVVSPLLAGGRLAVFGDPGCYAGVGDRRIGRISEHGDGTVSMLVLGVPGSTVAVEGWAAAPLRTTTWLPDRHQDAEVPAGPWRAAVEVGPHGWTRLVLDAG